MGIKASLCGGNGLKVNYPIDREILATSPLLKEYPPPQDKRSARRKTADLVAGKLVASGLFTLELLTRNLERILLHRIQLLALWT